MNNNNFDDLEFIDLDELDNSTDIRPAAPGTSSQVNYNALIDDEVTADTINLDFIDESFADTASDDDFDNNNFIARSLETPSDDNDYKAISDDDEDAEAEARRKRRAAKARAEKRRKKKQQLLIRRCVFCGAVLVFIVSGVLLVKSLFDYSKGDKIYENVQNQVFITDANTVNGLSGTTKPTTADNPKQTDEAGVYSPVHVLMDNYDHSALLALNRDSMGYLQIPAIDLLLPVVQGDDNEYYLYHTITGESNKSGTLFIDSRDTKGIESQNVIIYGHNMKNDSMFGKLSNFMDNKFFAAGDNKYFYFYIKDKIYKYEIYSVHITDAVGETYSIIFPTPDSFVQYFNKMARASYHATSLTATGYSQTMTLSTCVDDDSKRLVVQALRIGEVQP